MSLCVCVPQTHYKIVMATKKHLIMCDNILKLCSIYNKSVVQHSSSYSLLVFAATCNIHVLDIEKNWIKKWHPVLIQI